MIDNKKKRGMDAAPMMRPPAMPMAQPQAAPEMPMSPAAEVAQPIDMSAMEGIKALQQVIGREQIQEARNILQKYKAGKANLEQKIIEAEQWYKLRNWECMRKSKTNQVEPVSGWLFNSIANKHADAMDNFPSANILPREEGDKGEAEMLSSIIPVIMEQNNFERTYDSEMDDKLKSGTGVYGIFWDKDKLNGLGDIAIRDEDVLSLFWEPGITDIQESRHFFHVALVENDELVGQYPQLAGKLGSSSLDLSRYIYDDSVDTTTKSAVIDWYYKKRMGSKNILHLCKFVNDEVLFATENEPEYQEGWYQHGMYPYVFDPLYRMKGTPCGFGYVDIGKSAQEYIDRGNQAILQNMLANAKPRYFIRADGSVNEEEYADLTKDFVHVDGNLGADSVAPIQGKPLNNAYITVITNKIEELKETTGNRDISTGGTTSGVTAASAIAAMQEAGSKLSRDNNKASYRCYREVVLMVIELIRQFYDLERCFRIQGDQGQESFERFSNIGIKPQVQAAGMGLEKTYRLPLFDIEVSVQKKNAYSQLSQNELAIQFYNSGFFDPARADQVLACLDIMDFDRKQLVIEKIQTNQTMYALLQQAQQRCFQLAQLVDKLTGKSNLAGAIAAEGGGMSVGGGGPVQMSQEGAMALGAEFGEPENTKKARQRVAESTNPA